MSTVLAYKLQRRPLPSKKNISYPRELKRGKGKETAEEARRGEGRREDKLKA